MLIRFLLLILCVIPFNVYAQGNFFESLATEVLKGAKGENKEVVKEPTPSLQQSAAMPSASVNSDPQKQFPCLSKICLNDLILNHQETVQWFDQSERLTKAMYEPAHDRIVIFDANGKSKSSGHVAAKEKDDSNIRFRRDWIKKYVKGITVDDQEKLLPYLVLEAADKGLFQFLTTKKPIFCRALKLSAIFISESGHKTGVIISPNAANEYRIIALERYYRAEDAIALASTRASVIEQFPYLAKSPVPSEQPWGWGTLTLPSSPLRNSMDLEFIFGDTENFTDKSLSQQTACNQTKGAVD